MSEKQMSDNKSNAPADEKKKKNCLSHMQKLYV